MRHQGGNAGGGHAVHQFGDGARQGGLARRSQPDLREPLQRLVHHLVGVLEVLEVPRDEGVVRAHVEEAVAGEADVPFFSISG